MSDVMFFGYSFYKIFYYFVLYSFSGWCLETTYATIKNRIFVNRGFLYGPFCPMYGFGSVLLLVFSTPVKSNYIKLFIMCLIGASVLEYFTGFILEKLFNSKWWDYSKSPFNIKGRVCILYSILWGILGIFLIKILHPYGVDLLTNFIPKKIGTKLMYILIIYFIIDFVRTLIKLYQLKNLLSQLENIALGNITGELKERYEYVINKIVARYSRLFKAFPQLNSKKIKEAFKDIRDRIKVTVTDSSKKISNRNKNILVPHFIKVIGYMYQLSKRNIKAYRYAVVVPKQEPIVNNSIHWVGHATTVINLDGKIIVTDPVMSNLGFIKRLVKPSVNLKKMKVDYILLSHGHMDHLDYKVLLGMDKNAIVIVPRGIKRILKLIGYKNVVVIKDGEEYSDDFLHIKCIKSEHSGSRYAYLGYKDSNSYLISSKEKSVLFAGDTSNTDIYKDIEVDVAIMPVGCYKPEEYLKMHCSPEESFYMFKMMKCNYMIPVHYKTYILAQDDDNETIMKLNELNDGSIKIIDIGQTVIIN